MKKNYLFLKSIFSLLALFLSFLSFAQTYNSSGTYTVPPGVTSVTVQAWGAGGAGGGSTNNGQRGSGGGAGGYSFGTVAVTPADKIPFIVGAGGTGSTGNGSSGGDSSFLSLTAKGGTGGGANNGNVGKGGSASGADVNIGGEDGIGGNISGNGGSSPKGGKGGNGRSNTDGDPGGIPGGGGGGGERLLLISRAGGNGGNGQIIISRTPEYLANIISADTGPTTWCAGETRNISVTIKNIGTKPWKNQGTDVFNIGVKWNTNGTSWSDYNVRVPAQDLAPGDTKTYTFSIKAANNVSGTYGGNLAGINNLTFDVVFENKFWFGDNHNGGGPGNRIFTTPNQTIGALPAAPTPVMPNTAQFLCSGGSVNLKATSTGNTIVWYTSATGGIAVGTSASAADFPVVPPVGTTTYYAESRNSNGCVSATRTPTALITVNSTSPPTITTITQPTCSTATGSVVLNNLPTGPWVLTRNPGSITSTGTGTSTTISGLTADTYNFSVSSTNNGLKGEYFSNMTLSGSPILTRTDATIDFDWGNGSPDSTIPNDRFSVRWSGYVQPLYSETYTFSTLSDDGVRLWVNGVKIIDNWTDHGATTNTGTISLTAGVKYFMVLEYYENTGGAVSKLSWSSSRQSSQIIPTLQLFTDASCPSAPSANVIINTQPATPAAPTITASGSTTFCAGGSVTLTSSAGTNYLWSTGETTASIIVATSGSYSVRVTNAGGCQSSSSAATVVKVNPLAVTPGAPTALNLLLSGAAVTGSFTAPSTLPSGYVIARSTNATMPAPANGTSYTTGATVGNYYVIRGTDTPTTAVNFTDTLPTYGTYYYFVFAFNMGCGTVPVYSDGIKKSVERLCSSTSSISTRYISNVQFVGSLSPDTDKTTGYDAPGYSDFKNETLKATQIPGGVINLNVKVNGPAGDPNSTIKAWVDWNRNGLFEEGEKVFDTQAVGTITTNVIFGFEVRDTASPASYDIRIKASGQNESGFGPCDNLNSGETEDYSFNVIADCAAKIISVSAAKQCGPGKVQLTAVGNTSTSSYYWYDSEFGSPLAGPTSNQYTTASLPVGRYTYYVAGSNGSCQSVVRTPVVVIVSPTPVIAFVKSQPDICGESPGLKVTTSGDQEEVTLLQENFDDLNKLKFQNEIKGNADPNGVWAVRESPFISKAPPYNTNTPAVSSGFNGGNFAHISTDLKQTSSILNNLVLNENLNTEGFSELKLDFDLYYFSEEDLEAKNYLKVQYSLNNGQDWSDLVTYFTDQGVPSRFKRISLAFPQSVEGQAQVTLRFSVFALGTAKADGTVLEWISDVVGIDNIRVYGNKALSTPFTWNSTNVDMYNSDCMTPYSGASNTVCVKPTNTQLENSEVFTIVAGATLSNGCVASASTTIVNSNKIWNNASSTNNWSTASDWKPTGSNAVPTAEHCVIVKSPVVIGADLSAFAKNIRVETGGKLDIQGNLTVTDFVVNKNTEGDHLILKSDANLIQLHDSKTMNEGQMLAERAVQGIKYNPASGPAQVIDYVYWSSPVLGQKTKGAGGFSPRTPANRFYSYRESNDKFYETADLTFTPGRGYAVRAEEGLGNPYAKTYEFRGIPNNGDIAFGIIRTPDNPVVRGYNMVGNPYPSNIDFDELYYGNSNLIYNTVWFWTNSTFTLQQMGSGYAGNNYAVYNGAGGVPATYDPESPYTGDLTPNGVIKVGQGFLIQKKEVGTDNLIFKNSYAPGHNLRVADTGTFFTRGGTQKNRFWLKLSSPNGLVNTQLIGYFPAATDGYEQDYDAEIMSMSSDLFYSKLGNKQLLIQGKGNFAVEDKVVLGANFYKNTSYTISLDSAEGIFNNGQKIYLKDKTAGTLTDLTATPYTFAAAAGISEGRFEIQYKPEQILASEGSVKENLSIYKDGNSFVVKAQSKKITTLELYDSSGRLIYTVRPNSTKVVISTETLNEGVYILKINQDTVQTLRKVLK